MATFTPITESIEVCDAAWNLRTKEIFNDVKLLQLLTKLHRRHQKQRMDLLDRRAKRQKEFDRGALPGYIVDHPGQYGNWKVAPIPKDLQRRRVEITGPVSSAKMVIQMLSGTGKGDHADTAMLDFEDSMKPSWNNVISGYENILAVASEKLEFTQPATDNKPSKTYKLNAEKMALPMVRVRGLHLNETNLRVDGIPISAGLLDLTTCAYLTAKMLLETGKTPKYYVPKTEHFLEAKWWNDLFRDIEEAIALDRGTLRCTFLIETLPAAFQMEEILYEIRERACGLNGGRWDKIFSDIKVLKMHKDRVLADRASIDMQRPWMDNYAKRIIKICHKRGAFAMGGMSAFTPGSEPEVRKQQTAKVQADKAHEAAIGHDGCWVSHPYFVSKALEAFKQDNQVDKQLDDFPDRPELLPTNDGEKTLEGLRKNVRVGIAYIKGWNEDIGCVSFEGLMEDLATLEISRAQTWQWLKHGARLTNGEIVIPKLVEKLFSEELQIILGSEKIARGNQISREDWQQLEASYQEASKQACELYLSEHLDEFLTINSGLASAANV